MPSARKRKENGAKNSMAVDYMDLHIVRPNAAIGLHRHRDNQEIFMAMAIVAV